jgi:hypothetical protein
LSENGSLTSIGRSRSGLILSSLVRYQQRDMTGIRLTSRYNRRSCARCRLDWPGRDEGFPELGRRASNPDCRVDTCSSVLCPYLCVLCAPGRAPFAGLATEFDADTEATRTTEKTM